MCGIAGIINFITEPVFETSIKKMTDSIAHRGPDGEGMFVDENIGFGHRRLAILDLSVAGKQPMFSDDARYVITYNGEVYNFKTIRGELAGLGHQFRSNTDSEVILKSYIEWGEKCVHKFNGMFAFAILDRHSKDVFIARDRYGIKPFYYYQDSERFVFGSEVKAIHASALAKPVLDKKGLLQYMTFQNFINEDTLYKNVKLLPAGCTGLINTNKKSFENKAILGF